MDVHGNVDMLGNKLKQVSLAEEDFPAVPTVGRFVFKNQVLYVCVDLSGGIPVWVPITSNLNMRKFVQAVPASEWIIVHGLNCNDVFVQVYDANGYWILPNDQNAGTFNQVTLSFNTPTAGTCIIMRGNDEGTAYPLIAYENSYTNQATWVVQHSLGYNPMIQCFINNQLVQPQSIVFNNLNQATVVFSSAQTGTVRCI